MQSSELASPAFEIMKLILHVTLREAYMLEYDFWAEVTTAVTLSDLV